MNSGGVAPGLCVFAHAFVWPGGGRSSSSGAPEPGTAASRWRELALGVVGSYLLLGLMIALSAGLANGSLAFVSQPVKVLFKSSKVLPVMFFRAILGNSGANSWADYGYAIMLGLGLALFSASDVANTSSRGSDTAHQLVGMAMLLGSVCCDAMAPNLQERLLRKLGQPRPAVVLNTNALSALLTAAVWFPTGEAAAVHAWFGTHRSALRILLLQSVVGYLGVLAYLGCIRHAGSKATVLVTTARKMCTIFLSYSIFSDSGVFTPRHGLGLLMAVGGMTGSALREAVQMKTDAAAAAVAAAGAATAAGGAGAPTTGTAGDASPPGGGRGTSGGGAGAAGEGRGGGGIDGGDGVPVPGSGAIGAGGDVESASSGTMMRRLLGSSSQAPGGVRRSAGSSSTLAGEAV